MAVIWYLKKTSIMTLNEVNLECFCDNMLLCVIPSASWFYVSPLDLSFPRENTVQGVLDSGRLVRLLTAR